MDETFMLILLVIVMLIGSYLAGSIPLVVSMSEQKLKIITIFGAGLLVGTALTVIIPEGIRALYSEILHQHHPSINNDGGGFHPQQHQQYSGNIIQNPIINPTMPEQNENENVNVHFRDQLKQQQQQQQHQQHKIEHQATEYSSTIGISLVLGFVFMMLVDQISSRRKSSSTTTTTSSSSSSSSTSSNLSLTGSGTDNFIYHSDKNSTATIGLVVHAAADGIALGAAATTSHQDVEMIVFLAIMLHKAPAAFGLVTFLLHEGIDHQRIRKHLAIFSMSAPVFALLTYFGIGQDQKETLNSLNATGIAMLFSGGTFLYVATVHVLPELTTSNQHSHSSSSSSQHQSSNRHHRHFYNNKSTKYNHLNEHDDDVDVDVDDDQNLILGMEQSGMGTSASASSTATASTSIVMQQQQQSSLNNNNNNGTSSSILISNHHPHSHPHPHHHHKGYTELKNLELAILITGALLPLLLTMGHHH